MPMWMPERRVPVPEVFATLQGPVPVKAPLPKRALTCKLPASMQGHVARDVYSKGILSILSNIVNPLHYGLWRPVCSI